MNAAEYRGPGVHHRIDDSPDEHDMDLDSRFRPSTGTGGRIILLGDGTEIETNGADNEMFNNDDEDKDLDSQVSKFSKDDSKREGTPGPSTTEVTESPSSVATEKSDDKDSTTSESTKATTVSGK